MSPLAGWTVLVLYPIAPLYCAARSATHTGVVRVLPAPGGVCSTGEQDISNRRAPSPRRDAREPSALSLSLRLLMTHVYITNYCTSRGLSVCYK